MTNSVRIPADVDREDRILGGFTARQVAVLAVTAVILYGGWQATRVVIPVIAYVLFAVPIAVAVTVLVTVRRDGVALDRLLLAAVRQRLQPRRRVAAGQAPAEVPEWLAGVAHGHEAVAAGGLDLPAQGVAEAGVVDLGDDGVALVGACSTVNFALRTPGEQEALTAAFGRYLHSLGASVQILVRAQRLDLSGQIAELYDRAAGLPHPALESAALDHADYLAELGAQTDLLRRQILLVVREPVRTTTQDPLTRTRLFGRARSGDAPPSDGARKAAASRLVRRMSEATELLTPAGISVTALDAAQATAVLSTATNPDSPLPPSAEMASASSPKGPERNTTSELRNLLQILPFSAGAVPPLGESFIILSFAGPDEPDVAFADHLTGCVYVEDSDELACRRFHPQASRPAQASGGHPKSASSHTVAFGHAASDGHLPWDARERSPR